MIKTLMKTMIKQNWTCQVVKRVLVTLTWVLEGHNDLYERD